MEVEILKYYIGGRNFIGLWWILVSCMGFGGFWSNFNALRSTFDEF